MRGKPKGTYSDGAEQLKIAEGLGYKTVAQAMIHEYKKYQSCKKMEPIFGITEDGINKRLRALGVKMRKRGWSKPAVKVTRDGYIDICFSDEKTAVIAVRHGISIPTILKIRRGYVPNIID